MFYFFWVGGGADGQKEIICAGEVEVDTTKKRGRPSTPSKVTPPSKKASEGLGGSRVHFARNGEISEEDGESSDDQV